MADDIVVRGSILGAREHDYTDVEKGMMLMIARALRDRHEQAYYKTQSVVDDMSFFSRIAAGVYEMAKQTKSMAVTSRKPHVRERGYDEWFFIITGLKLNIMGDSLMTITTDQDRTDHDQKEKEEEEEGIAKEETDVIDI